MDRTCSKSDRVLIGFTVGVWDLFHKGHSIFLERCRDYCDYLVIGVMTDYWVRVQKGDSRPIDLLKERVSSVSGYSDRTVILDTLDMSHYLQMADVWIKSEGQNKMKPEEFQHIVVLPRTPGISTTGIINDK